MLKAFQDAPLHTSADRIQGGYFASIEAYKFSGSNDEETYELVTKSLPEADVQDWAWQQGRYTRKSLRTTSRKLEGGIRLLLAQSKSGFREAIPGVLLTGKILEALKLPLCSFISFQQASGVFSAHSLPEDVVDEECDRLGLIFRTPQKWECSIGGLATSFDFNTGITTALNLGYAFDLDQFMLDIPPPSLAAFASQLNACQAYWTHPILLPCQFLVTHTLKVGSYVLEKVSHQVVLLEHSVGVTKAGRSQKNYLDFPNEGEHADDQRLFLGEHLQRDHAKKLIVSINDLTTWIIFAKRSPQWDIDCTNFLLDFMARNQKIQKFQRSTHKNFRETLEYVRNYSEACLEITQTSEARMQLQLNILYTSIAQDDGQTSARIAASAGKDSTSMKIIALITAAYLPGTFVATLFSMGMFAWQNSSETEHSSVSSDFWIYWAVTVPLTIVTLTGWAIWWKFEEHRFDRDIQKAVNDRPTSQGLKEGKLPWVGR